MNPDRKKIILKEIVYWKENKLLPESYCNFLLTLYTEGEENQIPTKTSNSEKKPLLMILIIGMVLPILFLVTYFTEISPHLQMVINFIFLIICLLAAVLSKNNKLLLHVSFIAAALFMFLLTVKAVEIFLHGKSTFVVIAVLINCICWGLIGIKTDKKYFLVAGILGSILVIISLFI
ncbi:hypothetical protein [Fredinandcohnia quinoae]|uniref:Uncharacterized protein n=1 Tax=Fredinandcohnia quinoae TaxID=2918902 RepID=A0AAW5E746_9BACI|nr:hypothetical protein [Fredinandcohnia sp. SECRCQ15]MCH1624963.1 hypothetical protein [Fredinandcohnia sp. SECRCQ15]